MLFVADPEVFLGSLTCPKCGEHWWATHLQAGDVRVQLMSDYDGDYWLVDQLMALFRLPASIEQPMFWQIWLTGNQSHHFHKAERTGIRARSAALLRSLLRRPL